MHQTQTSSPGAVVIITNDTQAKFVMQRKDATHPIRACRKRLSLFGGSLEGGESPCQGVTRELIEEIRDPAALQQLHELNSGNSHKA